MEVKELVINTLNQSDKPLKAGEIAEISGADKKDIDKAIKELKSEDRIHSPKRCFYAVK